MLSAYDLLWRDLLRDYPRGTKVFRIGVTLFDLSQSDQRQLDFLINDDVNRQKWERINGALDTLNARFGRTVASLGKWSPPAGGHVGGKIAFTRIPDAEDFW